MRLVLGLGLVGCTGGELCPSLDPACRPAELAPFRLISVDPGLSEMMNGRLLLTQIDDQSTTSFTTIINGSAEQVFWWEPDPGLRLIRSRLGRDGETITVGLRPPDNRELDAFFARLELETGKELSRTSGFDHHHDHVELEDGRIAYLSRNRLPDKWFGTKWPLAVDVVRMEGPDNEVLIDLLGTLGVEPFWSCSHMGARNFVKGALDWTHANSLVFDEATQSLTLGLRHFDAVARVGLDGKVQWWLGAPPGGLGGFGNPRAIAVPNRLTPLNGAQPPRHGHFSEAWADGLIVFDNGGHELDPITRIVEYAIDVEALTYEEVWSYRDPLGRFFGARGDVVRLPGGNRLIAFSAVGQLWEVTPKGEIVWEAETDQKVLRIQFLPGSD
ncbi:MAG: aryl-sulfate sulfotransferase [Myxococcota bacterium]